jgi:hypothetical protein
LGKRTSQTRAKGYRREQKCQRLLIKSHPLELPLVTFYSSGHLRLRGVHARLRSHRSYRSISLVLAHGAVVLLPECFCQALERATGLGRSMARRAIESITGGLPPGELPRKCGLAQASPSKPAKPVGLYGSGPAAQASAA